MSKRSKQIRNEHFFEVDLPNIISLIEKHGFQLKEFTIYHYRVTSTQGRFDFYNSTPYQSVKEQIENLAWRVSVSKKPKVEEEFRAPIKDEFLLDKIIGRRA